MFRRFVWPERDVVNALLHDETGLVSKQTKLKRRSLKGVKRAKWHATCPIVQTGPIRHEFSRFCHFHTAQKCIYCTV